MVTRFARLSFAIVAVLCGTRLLASEADGQDEEPAAKRIRRLDPWCSGFGGDEVKIRCVARAPDRFTGVMLWSLETQERRILFRGEAPVATQAGSAEISFDLKLPVVKEGAVLPVQLSFRLLEAGGMRVVDETMERMWIFPRNPFHDRLQWARALPISLFDPVGVTAARFKEESIPFVAVERLSVLEQVAQGAVVIGEGVSFREERGLAEAMDVLAARGVGVICLAPARGELPVPQPKFRGRNGPESLTFSNGDVIRRLDKRLDSLHWMSEQSVPSHTLVLTRDGSETVGEVTAGTEGWPWVEWRYPRKESPKAAPGRLVVCCFPVIRHWERGPTPRFLMLRMLEYVVAVEKIDPELFTSETDSQKP